MLRNNKDSSLNRHSGVQSGAVSGGCGDRHLACYGPRIGAKSADILLTSPAFADGAAIPDRRAGVELGENISPPLEWSGAPAWTAKLV
jgi:hypothetical protein